MHKWRTALSIVASISGLLGIGASGVVLAQEAHHQIQQIDQQRREAQQRSIQHHQRERGRVVAPVPRGYATAGVDERCFDIRTIQLQGVSVFPRKSLTPVLSNYQGKCLGLSQLDALLNDISAFYFNRGYVTSRAYLTEQDLSSGTLAIQVVEGVLQSIRDSDKNTKSTNQSLSQVFPRGIAEPLNLRDLEQGLENINRLQSYQATMELLPGSALGETDVEVSQRVTKPWRLQFKSNNSGQVSTGEQQLQGLLSWDNPLGLYDFAYFSYQTDTELSRDKRYSESLAFHWDRPFGYWSIGLDLSRFQYKRTVAGNAVSFSASGVTETQQLSIGHVLFRDRDSKARLIWALTRKRSDNYVEDVLLDVSSRTLALSDVTFQHEHYFPSGAFLLSEFTYTRGLNGFGSPDDDQLPGPDRSRAPKAQFDRYSTLLDYRYPFQWLGQPLQYKTQWKTQYSPDVLFGSEQISIGSFYTVRGYKSSSVSGDSGSYWRNDLSWIIRPQWRWDVLNLLVPYFGVDAGRVRNINQAHRYRSLKGWTLGVTAQGHSWQAEMSFSKPINAPGDLNDTGGEFSFSLTATF